jgi:2-polyprenyl-6-methoxyphenol hydroxylase-like FAD-dependent oxidoreductase
MNEEIIDVIIVGCGIGGLVSALCLNRCGIKVRLYEQAENLEPIGFGLNLQPYSVKILYELGLENELNEIGIQTRRVLFYSNNSKYLFEDFRGLDGGYHWPMYSIHRGHFHQILIRHVKEKLGQSQIKLSQKLISFKSYQDYVQIDFIHTITGDLITDKAKYFIGADGINSTVRKILYPNEGTPIWRGLNIWRGVAPVDQIYLDGKTMICFGNPDRKYLIIYPLNKHLINWAFVIRVSNEQSSCLTNTSDWTQQSHIDNLLPLIDDINLDFIDIKQLIKSSKIVNEFPLTDRDLIPKWTFDRVTLLGDAAHPMYPNGGNGASQAILDAKQLYLSFKQYGLNIQALQSYEDIRRPQTNQFVLSARNYGPDLILRIIDERSSNNFNQLLDIISQQEFEQIFLNYKQISGWNAQLLNNEPPIFF